MSAHAAWQHPETQSAVRAHGRAVDHWHELLACDPVAADAWFRDVVIPALERMVDAYTAHGGSL